MQRLEGHAMEPDPPRVQVPAPLLLLCDPASQFLHLYKEEDERIYPQGDTETE